MSLRQSGFALIVLLIPIHPPISAAVPTFHGLGYLSGGSPESVAFGVSADGTVVVGRASAGGNDAPFIWREGSGMMSLAVSIPSCPTGAAHGVSPNGLVVAVACGSRAVRWSETDGPEDLDTLPGGTYGYAFGLSQDGNVIVGYGDSAASSNHEAFRWTRAGGTGGLGDLPGGSFTSSASDVTPDGSVIVGSGITDDGTRAFRWTIDAGLAPLSGDPAGQFDTWANAVSSDGAAVVGIISRPDGSSEAYRWTESTGVVGLGDLPGGGSAPRSEAVGVSGDGRIVVGHGLTDLGDEAFIWDPDNGLRRVVDALSEDFGLDLAGWQLLNASDVSNDGATIVGWGINPGGTYEAWRAVIPEPSPALMLSVAVMVTMLMRGWRAGQP